MKKLNRTMLTALVAMSMGYAGCSKEGCTDPDSENFDSKAKKDDGTCQYKGKIAFWTKTCNTGDITIKLNGTYNGTVSSCITSGEGDCGDQFSLTIEKDLGTVKTKGYTLIAEAEDGSIWNATVNFVANTCTTFELN